MIALFVLWLAEREASKMSPRQLKSRKHIPYRPFRVWRWWYQPRRYARPGSLTLELILGHDDLFGNGDLMRALHPDSPFKFDQDFWSALRTEAA